MILNIPTLGIRFDIDKINSAAYGFQCWKTFWQVVELKKLRGSILFEGDTNATLCGIENVFCIAIQTMIGTQLKEIRTQLEQNPEFLKIASFPHFVEGNFAWNEPLVEAGRIDAAGQLIKDIY